MTLARSNNIMPVNQAHNVQNHTRRKTKIENNNMTENKSISFSIEHKPIPVPSDTKASKSRNNFIRKLSRSFSRSKVDRDSDVDALRGIHGSNFEGYCIVSRGGGGVGCGCYRRGGDTLERFILVKGPFCFVFKNEDSPAPKYAFSFAHMTAHKQKPSHGIAVVFLQTALGDVEYEMRFSDDLEAAKFAATANEQAAKGESEEARKRLGHEHLLHRTKSVRRAETIAVGKIAAQPQKQQDYAADDMQTFFPIVGI
eukprot:scaffold1481_cov137-Cylindrotheca_fusiformis.AAC.12